MSAEQATRKLMGIDDPDFDAGTDPTSRDHKTLGHSRPRRRTARQLTPTSDGTSSSLSTARCPGPRTGTPVIFLNHLAAVPDDWDPRGRRR